MTCEEIREELVAYRDGELATVDRARIATHLGSCVACRQEEKQFARLEQLLTNMERITPSPDFAAMFWRRLEQEDHSPPPKKEGQLTRWWREWRESFSGWQMMPALAGAASVIVFFGYILSDHLSLRYSRLHKTTIQEQEPTTVRPLALQETQLRDDAEGVPPQLKENPGLFVNYGIVADLERLAHFDEIAATVIPEEPPIGIAESDVPQDLLQQPGFFANYPILQKMEELKNLETVLDAPSDEKNQGRG